MINIDASKMLWTPVGKRAETYPDGTLLRSVRSHDFLLLRVGRTHVFEFTNNETLLAASFQDDYLPVANATLVIEN